MNGIEPILEQVRLLLTQHAPSEALAKAIPFGIICLIAGTGLSVLGAKLSRYGLTCAFCLLGGAAGAWFGRVTGYPQPVCGALGALGIGIIGFQTFRMWVGVGAAIVLASVALGTFGYQQVVPHLAEFNELSAVSVEGAGSFEVPSQEEQEAYRNPTLPQRGREFWVYLTQKDTAVARQSQALGVAALLAGLCLGVLAVRTATIVSTSLVGTGLVTAGLGTLLTHLSDSRVVLQNHPAAAGIGVGAFLLASLLVQTLLTRNAPKMESEPGAKS